MKYTAQEVADFLHGVVDGDPDVELFDFGGIENGQEGTLSFLANPAYEHYLYTTKCSAVLVEADYRPTGEITTTLIRVSDPYDSLGGGELTICHRGPLGGGGSDRFGGTLCLHWEE